ncbi:MAG: hypothetical protein A2V88_09695 [Elusimicrobia bacterium RBG_16_66_12]|nr:MAG: hypothetical protein A2V88_09695 [Elusimicrobia bacterium RBG_16_66_12]
MTPRRLIPLACAMIFLAAFAGAAPAAETPKAKTKSSAKDKKKAAAAESRYKSRELSESTEHSYRFDARGNPVGGGKKKAEGKAKKKSSAPPEEKPEDKPGACTLEAPCPEKGSDADAL